MPSNFDSSATDLEDIFAPRSWFKLGTTLVTWGEGTFGQLGLNSIASSSSPVQVGSLTNWRQVSSGDSCAAAVKIDSTLWAWGINTSGKLGLNNSINRSSPVQIGTLAGWKQISAGADNNMAAIKNDGTLWTWGDNAFGALGLNTTINRSSPVQVGSLSNWDWVSSSTHILATKIDKTLWTWGSGGTGQLGLGNPYSISSPVQVGTLSDWERAEVSSTGAGSFSVAIKTDNTLWSWGYGGSGNLGLNNTNTINSPAQVGSLTNWKQIAPGFISCIATQTNGTLWAWGYAFGGKLGLNSITSRSSPTQVGTLTNWKQSSSGAFGSCGAVKTDGTLWSWGYGTGGSLGLNTTINRSSPIQVGTLTNWRQVSMGPALNAESVAIFDITDIN